MAEYLYKARTATGQLKTGEITATSEENAADLLGQHQLILTKLSPKKEGGFDASNLLAVFHRISMKDRVIFTRQLGTMIKSGLPIVQALHILAEQTANKRFSEVILDLSATVEGGGTFSAALAKYPKLFDRVYVNLVKSGEASGHLEEILERLAEQQEKSYRLAGKVRGAMMYPAFVMVALVGAAILMMIVVIPPLKTIFQDAGAQLPLPTRMLIAASDGLRAYWWLMIPVLAGIVFGMQRLLQTEGGKTTWDRLKLRLPIFGPLFQKIYISRMTRTLSSLTGGGVPILRALDIVGESTGNSVYEKALKDAAKDVEAGIPLSEPLRANPAFPAMVPQMISVGEQTGNLDGVLNKLADFYEEEVDNIVKNLSTLMEPILMVVMGIAVGGLLIAILMPIYNLGSVIN